MVVGGTAHGFGQTFAEFALQKPHNLAHALERKAALPQLTNHGYLGEVFHRIQTATSITGRDDDSALVPPLQLPWRDGSERDHLPGCEFGLQNPAFRTLETTMALNV